jgi:hypothetical protein
MTLQALLDEVRGKENEQVQEIAALQMEMQKQMKVDLDEMKRKQTERERAIAALKVCNLFHRLADHLVLSAALRRVPQEAVCVSVAQKPRRFRQERLSRAMRWSREHTEAHFGHGGMPLVISRCWNGSRARATITNATTA